MATVPDNPTLEWTAIGIWIALSLTWVVGLIAVSRSALRPIHWVMFLLIPIAFLTQQTMLDQSIFYCDAP
ncbi:MAG: hypothetical protein ABL912_06780 [Novosphingobium sp.]